MWLGFQGNMFEGERMSRNAGPREKEEKKIKIK
jgi:hypothetical protein